MKVLISLLLSLLCIVLSAQPRVSGVIRDEKAESIPYATVSLLSVRDSSYIVYSTCDDAGRYHLTAPQTGHYLLRVRSLGYIEQIQSVSFPDNSSIVVDFTLREGAIALGEVTISARAPGMRVMQDTVRYNPKAYTDGSEEVLGDVLKKLPGIEVSESGNVRAQGKQVEKIMLNGKDFFEGNTSMATKNLPADIAEKVEIINNYSDYSLLSGFQSHERTVMNIGVNNDWMGKLSGNLSLGGGVEDKYLGKGNLMQIKSTWMQSLTMAANNSGEDIFTHSDYMNLQGGVRAYVENNNGQSLAQYTEEEEALLRFDKNVSSRTSGLAAYNMAYQPNEKWKVSSYLLFNGGRKEAEQSAKTTYFLPGEQQYVHYSDVRNTVGHRIFLGSIKADYQPSKTFLLSYRANASNMNSNEQSTEWRQQMQERITGNDLLKNRTWKTNHQLQLLQAIGKHLFIVDASFRYMTHPLSAILQSDSLLVPLPLSPVDGWYYGKQNTDYSQAAVRLDLSFRYKIDDRYFLKTSVNVGTLQQRYDSKLYQTLPGEPEYLFPEEHLCNQIDYGMNDYNIGVLFVKNTGWLRFKAGGAGHFYSYNQLPSVANHSTRYKLQPQAEVSIFFNPQHYFTVAYSEADLPVPAYDFAQNIIFSGFRSYSRNSTMNHWYATQRKLSWSYTWIHLYWNTNLNISGNYSRSQNLSTFNYLPAGLTIENRKITSRPQDDFFMYLMLDKGLGFVPWKAQLLGVLFFRSTYNQINGTDNTTRSTNSRVSLQMVSNYKKQWNAELSAGMEYVESAFYQNSTNNFQWVQRYKGKLKYTIAKQFRSYIGLEYVVNHSSDWYREFYYLNAAVYYRFLKNKMEVGIEGVNMLNIKKQGWILTGSGGYYTSEIQLYQLPGHIMVRLNYRF
jgi:hypothetical protein